MSTFRIYKGQEGKKLHWKQHAKNITAFSIILLILTIFTALPAPKVFAVVTVSELSPNEGTVGTEVTVTGQISQVNGTYNIFFDDELVKTGSADTLTVFDIFFVPNATSGSHLVMLEDGTTGENDTANFTVLTEYIIGAVTPPHPKQLQEGANVTVIAAVTGGNMGNTSVNITITDPANVTHSLNTTISVGQYGNATIPFIYLVDFDQNPHTFYVGTYDMLLTRFSETLATGIFTIGLTNATEYHRFQTVHVQALNYTSNDRLRVKITHQNEPVFESSPENATGPEGKITANWTIPANASVGLYKVEVISSGTQKPVPENQTFTIVSKSFACEVKTVNLDKQPVEGIVVEANNTFSFDITSNTTNKEGIAHFYIEATNYTFNAFLNDTKVGNTTVISLSKNLTETLAPKINCSLAHIKMTVENEEGNPLPFININTNFTHTTRTTANISRTAATETNLTGIAILQNLFTNINYTIKASRYGNTFSTTTLNLTSTSWLNTTCPTLELVIKSLDRNHSPLKNAQVRVYDWGIGVNGTAIGEGNTDINGECPINLTFGKYIVRVHKDDYLLNETSTLLVNLTHPTNFVVYCKLYNLTLSVNVLDYFGQGISNANVTIERQGILLSSAPTGGNGVVQFTNLIGGNYKIFVYLAEKLYGITTLNLQEPETVTLKIGEIVSIGGFITETSVFTTSVLILLLMFFFLLALIYRRLKSRQKTE
jgi:hypothetical protein